MNTLRSLIVLLLLALLCPVAGSLAADHTNLAIVSLGITNTINSRTTFKVFRRRADNHYWDSGKAYPRTNGIALLKALDSSSRWDGKSHAMAYGMLHAYEPGISIEIDWSRNKKERKSRSIALCYGNRLFWFRDSLHQLPEKNYELVDRLFPQNK